MAWPCVVLQAPAVCPVSEQMWSLKAATDQWQTLRPMPPGIPAHSHTLLQSFPPHPHSLINNEDKEYFKKMLAELVSKHGLGASYDDLFVNRCACAGR